MNHFCQYCPSLLTAGINVGLTLAEPPINSPIKQESNKAGRVFNLYN